jgi:hypothetical protein
MKDRGFFAGVARPFFLEFSEGHFPPPFNSSTADWSMIQSVLLRSQGVDAKNEIFHKPACGRSERRLNITPTFAE